MVLDLDLKDLKYRNKIISLKKIITITRGGSEL